MRISGLFLLVYGVGALTAPTPRSAGVAPTLRPDIIPIMNVDATQEQAEVPPQKVEIITGRYVGPEGERAWRLAMPSAVGRAPRPVLVMLHGCLQDAADIARGSRLDALADAAGALVLYPEQPQSANPRKCWNWFDAGHQQRDKGEPALLSALVRDVVQRHGGDPSRVHLAGISAGGAMANLVVGAYPEQFASATIVAGVAWQAAPDVGRALAVMQQGAGEALPTGTALRAAMGTRARAVPVLVVHGLADQVVSIRNGDEVARQYVELHDAVGAAAQRAALVRTELATTVEHGYPVREVQWRDHRGKAAVTLLRVEQLGHAFPFGDPSGTFADPKGPDLMPRLVALLNGR